MREDDLTADELEALIRRVFRPAAGERALAILVDLPDVRLADTPAWARRRRMAADWTRALAGSEFEVRLFAYRNVRSNNADLPGHAWPVDPARSPDDADALAGRPSVAMVELLGSHPLVLAPTELSTTAPLKAMAPRLGFRAATMPGFSAAMVPALRLDYTEINRRVQHLKLLLDRAAAADIEFAVDGGPLELHLDLRHRTGHASGGLVTEPGTAGNLPSGEAYIVPYEGERPGDPTATAGLLPIQLGNEVVVYAIDRNRVTGVRSRGAVSTREQARLAAEPAAGNLAELGLGVLADFGISPIGEVLLDEKLGLHLAFGRSEHFGGRIGPDDFSSPEAVVHQDHVFLRELQPRVAVVRVSLSLDDGARLPLMRDGSYVIDFGA